MSKDAEFKKTLGPVMLWALGVGYVISGMYCGWNLGLIEGGPYGFLVATLGVTLLYVTFVMSYAELSCAIPKAGGAFVYAERALGAKLGYLAGCAQCIEFIFAPPAIAAAVGAYFHLFIPQLSPLTIGIATYLIFTGLNIYGTQQSAIFELVITVVAVFELFLFAGITAPYFTWEAFSRNPLPKGWIGILPSIPYAIWFYLAIEGIANVAEETKNPKRDLVLGFGSAMLTLVILALLTFFTSVGIQGWESVVYSPGNPNPSDSPLPLALKAVVGEGHVFYHLLIGIGLCGLLASFHGITLVAGRATFEMGRVGYAPKAVGKLHPTRNTPAVALLVNLVLGILALLTGKTGEIITLSVFGALTLYALSMVSLFQLRKSEPKLARPFLTPGYPFVPLIALLLSLFCLVAMSYYQPLLAFVYLGVLSLCFLWFYLRRAIT